jgi:hypothetical protein
MDSTLAHIAGAVKHGGQVAISGFQENHLLEVAALATKDGIWLDVGVLFAIGTKP